MHSDNNVTFLSAGVVERIADTSARVSGGIVSVLSAAIVLARLRATCYFPVPIVRFYSLHSR